MNKEIILLFKDQNLYNNELKKDFNQIDGSKATLIFDDSSSALWRNYFEEYSNLNRSFIPFEIFPKDVELLQLWPFEKEDAIQLFKKKYSFFYENYLFLLAPFVKEESNESVQRRGVSQEKRKIYCDIDIYFLAILEDFLFSDEENHFLCEKILELKENAEYLEKVKFGMDLLEKDRINKGLNAIDLSFSDLLVMIRAFVFFQTDKRISNPKMRVLDEFFRTVRYSNDGQIWQSGYHLDKVDIINNLGGKVYNSLKTTIIPVFRIEGDGIRNSRFIESFGYEPAFHLSEKDKQELYLKFHDELPWDFTMTCQDDEKTFKRPNDTSSCGSKFAVREHDIFVGDDKKFYCMCYNCGFIVNVSEELIPKNVQRYIRNMCNKRKGLFKKMCIYSELQVLDRESTNACKILVEKDDDTETYNFKKLKEKIKKENGGKKDE